MMLHATHLKQLKHVISLTILVGLMSFCFTVTVQAAAPLEPVFTLTTDSSGKSVGKLSWTAVPGATRYTYVRKGTASVFTNVPGTEDTIDFVRYPNLKASDQFVVIAYKDTADKPQELARAASTFTPTAPAEAPAATVTRTSTTGEIDLRSIKEVPPELVGPPNPSPTAASTLTATFKVKVEGGKTIGTLSWNAIPGATHYTFYREGFEKFKLPVTAATTEVVIDPSNPRYQNYQNLRADDRFVVQAVKISSPGQPFASSNVFNQDEAEQKSAVRARTEFGDISNLGQYASHIMRYALPLGIVLAVLMVTYAGIRFMISQGQPDKIKDSYEIIQGAVMGVVILILARFIVNFLYIPNTFTIDHSTNETITQTESRSQG